MQIQENVPLAPLTTLRVGGPARYFLEARNAAEVRQGLEFARSQGLAVFVLGGGSNLVIADAGWPGLVLKMAIAGIEENPEKEHTRFTVGAGDEWDKFVAHAVTRNCAGIECLSGIPGSVGGTPVQNVGAYGQEVSETIAAVEVLDRRDGEVRELCREACGFSYRSSVFNTSEPDRYIVLRVTYALTPGGRARLEYADLKRYFAGWSTTPSLAEVRDAVRKIRAAKAMLISDHDPDSRSAGSFFKNPMLSAEQFSEVHQRAAAKGLQIPSYPALASQRKISAAWLVEHSGFSKGLVAGPVGISRKHALAIVNRGGACAEDIAGFRDQIQQRVEEIWGIRLQTEPVFVGF